jgi:hypothetical protein
MWPSVLAASLTATGVVNSDPVGCGGTTGASAVSRTPRRAERERSWASPLMAYYQAVLWVGERFGHIDEARVRPHVALDAPAVPVKIQYCTVQYNTGDNPPVKHAELGR